MTLKNVTLDDKYDLTQSRVFVTGYQALIRACLMQQERAVVSALNRQIERDGFFAAMEAFRNAAKGLKDRALPGPHDYEQIPALAERGRPVSPTSSTRWTNALRRANLSRAAATRSRISPRWC